MKYLGPEIADSNRNEDTDSKKVDVITMNDKIEHSGPYSLLRKSSI